MVQGIRREGDYIRTQGERGVVKAKGGLFGR